MPLDQMNMPSSEEMGKAQEQTFHGARIKLSNNRRVLFLIKKEEQWKPARERMNISMAWQEPDGIYGFRQFFNPGPLFLTKLEETEKQFYQIMKDILAQQVKLYETRQITNMAKRANALSEFIVYPKYYLCQCDALQELRQCGDAAEAVILELLNDEEKKSLYSYHAELIRLYSQMFRERARPWLMHEVVNGLAYWKKLAPELTKDWWTQSSRYHTTYIKLYYSLGMLGEVGITEQDREPIESLIRFWKSQPVLDAMGKGHNNFGPVGESQIVESAQWCLKRK